ncbi:isopentenyl phosphate kinase [Halanaeroarchaeum sulfurireducens]|uniref:Isopentenyl phosphate kinase n=1 Tax=Halanaeroarchaeum sulfurireducens TaxID=1604004 RepID=A0A0F7PE94_9EURY|nr:isopentenyl phosphate kinase [Halanaeroarchaeum sulfurireducens]AKH97934.1 isopentenyl phosphate kinase [Halanaeroarchaeum sulfurireducens]ALG82328.1 isopentenyl phosphate kinase [Halanaeroarchaeum sulfurireducens]
MTTILKLGGSVVTDKDRRETVDDAALANAADAIAEADTEGLVVVHGGGSFGHPNAADRNVSATEGTTDAADVRAIHRAMGELLTTVTDELGAAGVPAVPVRPLSAGYRTVAGDVELSTETIAMMLEEGFVPILHGDVFATAGRGATIVSGDELVVALAAELDAERIGVCSTVPGVLDDEGDVVPTIERYAEAETVLGGSGSTDVTGGMAAKVESLLDATAPAYVFGLEDIGPFLSGAEAGTRIGPSP